MSKRRPKRESRPAIREEPAKRVPSVRLPAPNALLAAFALFLLVVGARWWLIARYGTDVPWLDQWDAEAAGLYQPWHAGTLSLHAWFAPHNEHRIFFTRALALGLLRLNGQWDPRLEMVTNAKIFAILSAVLFLLLRRGRTPGFQIFCWVLLAVLGCAPYGATNTLLGFQSQFYFLAGFSLLSIYALVNQRPGSLWWIAGAIAGCAALVSMGSGYAAALAVLGVLLCSIVRSRKEFRQQLVRTWPTALAAFAIVAAGVALRSAPAGHESLAAKSAGDFAAFFQACLSWPSSPMILFAIISWLPFALFLANYLRKQTPDDPGERFILGIGLWVLLQAAALAMYRANSGEGLESRYTDILAFGVLANGICAVWLLSATGILRRFMPILALVWLAVNGIGLYNASLEGPASSWKQAMEIRRAATAGYLASGDERVLERAPPHTDVKRVAALLSDPWIRTIVPAGIRPSLSLSPGGASPTPQFVNGVSMPDLSTVPPGLWDFPGMFSRFAVLPPATPFVYRIESKRALPFLLLYFVGDGYNASVADSHQSRHWMVPLPAGGDPQGHHAVVYCPPGDCTLSGSSGPFQLMIMEPKEIGTLSIAALFAASWGQWVMLAGAVLFLALVLAPMARQLP